MAAWRRGLFDQASHLSRRALSTATPASTLKRVTFKMLLEPDLENARMEPGRLPASLLPQSHLKSPFPIPCTQKPSSTAPLSHIIAPRWQRRARHFQMKHHRRRAVLVMLTRTAIA